MKNVMALLGFLAVAGFNFPVYSNHTMGHSTPPGLQSQQSVCDCLAVEISQTVFENSTRLVFDRPLRETIGALTVLGSMECTQPVAGSSTPGESIFRSAMHLLTGVQAVDQEFCRLE